MDFMAGVKESDAAETNPCVPKSYVCATLFSPVMGDKL